MAPAARGSALVVGAGLMGQWHARTLSRLAIPIAAVVDVDLARAQRLAGQVSAGGAFSSPEEALAATTPLVAHVCTPLESHVQVIGILLEAGVNVLAEKPLAASAAQTRSLLELAQEKGLQLCPVHQFLFQPGFIKCQARAQLSGRLLHVDYVATSAGADGAAPGRAEDVMRDILPHPLSMIRRIAGEQFGEIDWSVTPSPPGELRAQGAWSDTTAGIVISLHGRPTRNGLRLVTEGGTFHVDLFHGFGVRESPAVSRTRKVLRPFVLSSTSALAAGANLSRRLWRREPAYPGLRHLVSRFHDSLGGICPPPIGVDEIVDVSVARDQIIHRRTD